MGQILFSLSLSLYIPSAMDYGQSCDLFRLIQMVSALNSTSSLASNYPSSDNLCSYPNSGHPGPINNTVQQAELTFSKQDNTDGQVVESGDTPTRQLISKWRNAAWLRGLEQKEESAGIKKKPRCVLSSAKVFKWIGDRTSPQSTQDSYSLDAFYLSESKNPWLPVLITLLNQSEWIVTTCFRVMRIPSSTCQKRGHLMSVTWLNCKYKSEGPEVTFTCNLSSESTLTKENHHRVPGHVKNPPDHRSWRNHEKKE